MARSIFRESALQKLSSPEQLDQLIKITRPRSWIVLGTIGFILLVLVLWSIFGSLPTTISGPGIVIRPGGTFNIVALGSGTVTRFGDYTIDDEIHEGDVLGTISQPLLAQQIAAASTDLLNLEEDHAAVLAEIARKKIEQSKALAQQITFQNDNVSAKQLVLKSLELDLESQASLLADGLITRHQYEQTHQGILAVQQEIKAANNELQNLLIMDISIEDDNAEKIRQLDTSLASAKNRLANLNAQYRIVSEIVSERDGVVVETLISTGSTVAVNQPVMSLESGASELQVMIYMPPNSEAKRIKPGMDVQISLSTADQHRYGSLLGKVISISQYPSTPEGMEAVIHNSGIVREMSRAGQPFSIMVGLEQDPTSLSGYKWSSNAGKQVKIYSGTFAEGLFIIEKQAPISLIIPIFKNMVGF